MVPGPDAPSPGRSVAIIPGDGIGADVTAEVIKVLELLREKGLDLPWRVYDFSADRYLATRETLPEGALGELEAHRAVFLGAIGDPRVPDFRHARDVVLGIRKGLDLYVNERPIRLLHGSLTPLKGRGPEDIRFVILRENTEGEYAESGGVLRKGTSGEVAVENTLSTRKGVERIVRCAFQRAVRDGARSVVMADKHNAQRFSGDLWLRTYREVAREYPSVEARHMFVDTLCMEMVRDPSQFRVVVTGNLFGDIASDLGAALVGGLGLAPSANLNPETGKGMFEPVHGSAPGLAGKDRANPMAALLSAGMMLHFLGFPWEASALDAAVAACVSGGETTADLGGGLGTRAVGDAVAERLRRSLESRG